MSDPTINRLPDDQPDPMTPAEQTPPAVEAEQAEVDHSAELYCHAIASVEGLAQGENGWMHNDEKTQALIERGLLEKTDPPA